MSHPLYPKACALREEVLLGPIGYDMARYRRDFPGIEERLEHFVAVDGPDTLGQIIGCAALLPNDPKPGVGRLTQMAVNPQRQGEGVGRGLIVAAESRAFGELGLTELFGHAQLHMLGFYQRLGWEVDSEVFTEAGILHRRVVIRQPAETGD